MNFEISKKSEYAILAMYELALRGSHTPLNARKLASEQGLPIRFLEVILNELKQGGFVLSLRGKQGGYVLARPAKEITLSQIIGFLETTSPAASGFSPTPLPGTFTLTALVRQAGEAITAIFRQCTLDDLVQREMKCRGAFESNYVI
jgi:Rrf2 family protein